MIHIYIYTLYTYMFIYKYTSGAVPFLLGRYCVCNPSAASRSYKPLGLHSWDRGNCTRQSSIYYRLKLGLMLGSAVLAYITTSGRWFGTFFIVPFSWECHHPNWLSLIFFRGVGQPPYSPRFYLYIPTYRGHFQHGKIHPSFSPQPVLKFGESSHCFMDKSPEISVLHPQVGWIFQFLWQMTSVWSDVPPTLGWPVRFKWLALFRLGHLTWKRWVTKIH